MLHFAYLLWLISPNRSTDLLSHTGAAEGLNSIAHRMTNPLVLTAVVLIVSLAMACGRSSRPEAIDAAKSPEQIVFARSPLLTTQSFTIGQQMVHIVLRPGIADA